MRDVYYLKPTKGDDDSSSESSQRSASDDSVATRMAQTKFLGTPYPKEPRFLEPMDMRTLRITDSTSDLDNGVVPHLHPSHPGFIQSSHEVSPEYLTSWGKSTSAIYPYRSPSVEDAAVDATEKSQSSSRKAYRKSPTTAAARGKHSRSRSPSPLDLSQAIAPVPPFIPPVWQGPYSYESTGFSLMPAPHESRSKEGGSPLNPTSSLTNDPSYTAFVQNYCFVQSPAPSPSPPPSLMTNAWRAALGMDAFGGLYNHEMRSDSPMRTTPTPRDEDEEAEKRQRSSSRAFASAVSAGSGPAMRNRRIGYWNRRGDHLTESNQVVYCPQARCYPADLMDYPDDGFRNHFDQEVQGRSLRSDGFLEKLESVPTASGRLAMKTYDSVHHSLILRWLPLLTPSYSMSNSA